MDILRMDKQTDLDFIAIPAVINTKESGREISRMGKEKLHILTTALILDS